MFGNFHPRRLHGTQVERVLQRRGNTHEIGSPAIGVRVITVSIEYETKFAILVSPKFHEKFLSRPHLSNLLFSWSRVL